MSSTSIRRSSDRNAGNGMPPALTVVVVPDLCPPGDDAGIRPPDGQLLVERIADTVGDRGAVLTASAAEVEATLQELAGGPRVVVVPFSSRGSTRPSSGSGLRRLVRAVGPDPVVAWVPTGDVRAAGLALRSGAADYAAPHVTDQQLLRLLQAAVRSSDRTETARTERLWRTVMSRVSDAVVIVDPDGRLDHVTPAAASLFARMPATASDLLRLVHPADRRAAVTASEAWRASSTEPVALRVAGHDGWHRYEVTGLDLSDDPAVGGTVLTFRDVSARWEAQEQLARDVDRDPLTGLVGRRAFFDAVAFAVARSEPGGTVLALVDTDGLVRVNERHGHDVGDRLLVLMARHLEAAAPEGALVGRVDGGGFGVLWHPPSDTDPLTLGRRLAAAAVAVDDGGRGGAAPPRLAARVGVAATGADGPELLARADLALEEARGRGPQTVVAFDEDLARRIGRRRRLRADLHDVVGRGELDVHFMPIVALPTEQLVRFEARVRWHHPRLGLLEASQFVDLADETGDIVPIDLWVLQRAGDQLARWHRDRPDIPVGVTVNVSTRVIATPGFTDRVTGMLRAHALATSGLCLRIDAAGARDELDTVAGVLQRLRTAGVRLTARNLASESMMAVLRRVPLDYVSVDRRSVAGLGVEPLDTALVEALVRLAGRLDLVVVAEGVATAAQRDQLVALGCGAAQGPLWSGPVPADAAPALLDAAADPSAATRAWSPAWRPPRARRSGPAPAAEGAGADPDAIRPVLAYLAHELRNPLQTVQSFVELLRDQFAAPGAAPHAGQGADDISGNAGPDPDDAGAEALDGIERGIARVEGLVGSLRDVTDIQDRSLVLRRRAVDVADLARRLVADNAGAVGGRPVAVHTSGPTTAVVDAGRITQVVTNLLTNAAKFSPPGAPIDVAVSGDGATVAVHVVDRGPGIPPQRAPAIFRPFVTFDASGRGMGLGLFLARGIVRAHGGELRYRRAHTGGAEFIVSLPAGTPEGPAPGQPATGGSAAAAAPQAPGGSAGAPPPPSASASGPRPAASGAPTGPSPDAGSGRTAGTGGLAGVDLGADADALRAVLRATEGLLAAETPERAVGVAIDLVAELGGHVVVDGDPAPPGHTLPVDLSLGTGPPLWAVAEPVSAARTRLEAVLPAFAAVAATTARRVRRRSAPPHLDATTGFRRGSAAEALVEAAGAGEAVMVVRTGSRPDAVVSAARIVRAHAGRDRCLVLDPPADVGPAAAGPGEGPDRRDVAAVLPVDDVPALLGALVTHAAHAEPGQAPTVAWATVDPEEPGAAPDGRTAIDRDRAALAARSGGPVRRA